MSNEIPLRYGLNPNLQPARAWSEQGELPIQVRNGVPGYINLMDALSAWPLVRELSIATGEPAAASFKHVSPAGAAIGLPLSSDLRKAYQIEESDLSPVANAYIRARGGDLISSYGDFAAVSETVDSTLAKVLSREVSDGIIAPGYDADAYSILSKKKDGKYLVIEIDENYEPSGYERRDVFGINLEQPRDADPITEEIFSNVVTQKTELSPDARRDLLIATITLRYTQSNSVCLAVNGQVIGLGAGQQSRIHCTRLACSKADRWMLQQHPQVLDLPFRKELRRSDRFIAREQFISYQDMSPVERRHLQTMFTSGKVETLSALERRNWINEFTTVLSHDAFIPFRDNIDRAQASGVKYVMQPGGSIADTGVVKAADEYGMVMAFSGLRLFRH